MRRGGIVMLVSTAGDEILRFMRDLHHEALPYPHGGQRIVRNSLDLLPTHSLVIGICRRYHKLFSAGVENRLLRIVGTTRQGGHLNLQRNCIFRFAHVRVDA